MSQATLNVVMINFQWEAPV